MSNFQMVKLFDCQHMPEDIKTAFYSLHEVPNDVYVNHTVGDDHWDENVRDNHRLVDRWLLENGAEEHEWVLIAHWW